MVKIRTTITINKDLLKKAKHHSISISSFLDIELRRYIALIEGKQTNPHKFSEESNQSEIHNTFECGHRDSNPGYKLGKLGS